jgi:hypothetical protein
MHSLVSSTSHPTSLSTQLDLHQQYIHRTPVSTPTPRSQPQSPSQFQLIHNKNTFFQDPASPSSPKSHILPNTPVPKTPLTPPDSSGKTLVDIDVTPVPSGEPISITRCPEEFVPQNIIGSACVPLVSCAIFFLCSSGSVFIYKYLALVATETSPTRAPSFGGLSPSRTFQKNSSTESSQAQIYDSPTISFHSPQSSEAGFLASQSEASVGSTESNNPPNVYINGLPPNFPEEQLYNMTKEFGAITSVRTFTRHVSERPT